MIAAGVGVDGVDLGVDLGVDASMSVLGSTYKTQDCMTNTL